MNKNKNWSVQKTGTVNLDQIIWLHHRYIREYILYIYGLHFSKSTGCGRWFII